ncbi:hypothetical protein IWZ01DRAFT_220547 [Phyllosticta capitalensis]
MMYKYDTAAPGYMEEDSVSSQIPSSNDAAVVPDAGSDIDIEKVAEVLKSVVRFMEECLRLADAADELCKTPDFNKLRLCKLLGIPDDMQKWSRMAAANQLFEVSKMLERAADEIRDAEIKAEMEHATRETRDEDPEDGEQDEEDKIDMGDEEDDGDQEDEGDEVDEGDDQMSEGSRYQHVEYSSDDWECVEDEDTTEDSRSDQLSAT